MNLYYINKNSKTNPHEDNEVHTSDCHKCPSIINREDLGYFSNGNDAVAAAKRKGYHRADGCYHCSREAHHS